MLRRVKVDVYAIVDTIATGFPYCGASGTWNENLGISVNGEALPTVLTEGAFMCYSESPLAGTAKVYTSLSADFVTGFPGYLHGGSNTITISIAGITPPDGMSCPGYGINPNGGGIVLEAARITFT